MSTFIYNGIVLSPVLTGVFEKTVNLSDDGTEYKWTDVIINIACIFNPSQTSYVNGGVFPIQSAAFPATTDVAIRHYLMQPRKSLLFSQIDSALIAWPPLNGNNDAIDADNGPTPLNLVITNLVAGKLFHVNFTIKTSIIECPAGSFLSPIASNRYSRQESFDTQYRSTLITSGRAYFRSNVLAALAVNSDAYRGYLIPPPILGYQRVATMVGLDPDGTAMVWSTTDVEQFVDLGNINIGGSAASYGIVKMELMYTTGNASQGPQMPAASPMTQFAMSCTAYGIRDADTLTMLSFMNRVILSKLGTLATASILLNFSVTEDVFNNIVSTELQYLAFPQPGAGVGQLAAPITGVLGAPIAYLPYRNGANPYPPFSQGTRGSTQLLMAAASFAQACFTAIGSVAVDPTGTVQPADVGIPPVQVSNPPAVVQVFVLRINQDQTKIQQGVQSNRALGNAAQTGYLKYQLKSNYQSVEGNIQAPMALANYTPAPNDGTTTGTVMQVAARTSRRILEFQIERIQAVPEVPMPIFPSGGSIIPGGGFGGSSGNSSNYTLIGAEIQPMSVEMFADQSSILFKISGRYVYACNAPVSAGYDIPFDIPAYVNVDRGDNLYTVLSANDYVAQPANNNSSGGLA